MLPVSEAKRGSPNGDRAVRRMIWPEVIAHAEIVSAPVPGCSCSLCGMGRVGFRLHRSSPLRPRRMSLCASLLSARTRTIVTSAQEAWPLSMRHSVLRLSSCP